MKRNYVFRFKDIKFVTNDDGQGEDPIAAMILSRQYGRLRLETQASSQSEAKAYIFNQLIESSGFRIKEADYDIIIT